MNFIKTNCVLLRALRKLPSTNNRHTGSLSSIPPQKCESDVYVSIWIERQPVITQEKTKLEEKMQKTLSDIEFEKSKKSNFELLKEGKLHLLKKAPEEYFTQTAVDIEENCKNELKNLKTNPRISGEKTNDVKSKLSDSLFLLTEESSKGEKGVLLPPKGIVNEGETLKQAAKRILNESCGDTFNAFLYGNAPIGYTVLATKDNTSRNKVFYFLARYETGSITTKNKHEWLTANELTKVLPEKIYKHINHLFITSK